MAKSTKTVSIFDHKLNKGDITGAIDTALLEADNAKQIAQEAIAELKQNQQRLAQKAQSVMDKHQLL